MKSPRRALRGAVALLLISTFLLSACGPEATPTQPAAQPTAQPTQALQPTPDIAAAVQATLTAGAGAGQNAADVGAAVQATLTAEAAARPTERPQAGFKMNPDVSGTVDLWHFWGSPVRRNAIRRVVALCQAQMPNIKITETFKPFGELYTANTAAVAAGSGMADVIVSDRGQLLREAQANIYTNLGEHAERDGVTGEEFWPFAWQQTVLNGDTYGLPFETDIRVLYYNKQAFTEAGLDPTKPPTTWEEAWEYAQKLDKKAADGTFERIGFYPLWNAGPDIWGHTNSVKWALSPTEPKVNSPEAIETYEWIKRFIDHYGGFDEVQKIGATFASPPQDRFMSGRVAMVADINGYVSQLNFFRPQIPDPKDPSKRVVLDWGVSQLPYNSQPGNWSGGFSLSVPRGAKNVDAAWEFIKCAAGPQGSASWSRDTYAMSANVEAAQDPTLMADPAWQFFLEGMETSYVDPYVEKYPNYMEQVTGLQEGIWRGTMSPADALNQAQQKIEEELAKR